MQWFIKALKNYANFNGRARRKEYWFFILFVFIFSIVAGILDIIFGTRFTFGGSLDYGFGLDYGFEFSGYISLIFYLAIILPWIAVTVRRLHDQGKSGVWYFIAFIPLIGVIWMLVLMFTEGTRGPNQYGPDPKQGEA